MLARAVKQVDLAFIFANHALEAGIDTDKALLVEKAAICTSNIWWRVRTIFRTRAFQKLAQALHSDAVRQFILTRYQGQNFTRILNHCGQRRRPLPGQTERIIVTRISPPHRSILSLLVSAKAYPNGVQALQGH